MVPYLPEIIWQEIFELVILSSRPREVTYRVAVTLRLVCKLFDREIRRALCTTRVLKDAYLSQMFPSEELLIEYIRFQIIRRDRSPMYLNRFIHLLAYTFGRSSDGEVSESDRQLYAMELAKAVVKGRSAVGAVEILHSDLHFDFTRTEFYSPTLEPDSAAFNRDILCVAAYLGNNAVVQDLISQGISCNERSYIFGYPLHLAASRGHVDTVKLLLEAGVNPGLRALEHDHCVFLNDIADFLEPPASLEAADIDSTALQMACFAGEWEIIRLLLPPKNQIPRRDVEYHRSVFCAIKGNHMDIANYLIDLGDLNSMPDSFLRQFWHLALLIACEHGHEEIVRTLVVDNSVSVEHWKNGENDVFLPCPLALAASHDFVPIVKLLLDKGANPDRVYRTRKGSHTILNTTALRGHLKSLQLILDASRSPNALKTAVKYAARGGHEHVIRNFANKGLLEDIAEPDFVGDCVEVARQAGFEWMGAVFESLGFSVGS